MTIRISKNIRSFRKARRMTQEQLAEALGVTVGAVSKWESGASMPDVSLIVAMADFFETSVDVLLGYEWRSGGMGQMLERIRLLRNGKKFDEAAAEAEKALQKYPNSFDVVFQSGILYSMQGIERRSQSAFRKALSLFERSLELIAQNSNDRINEWTIRNRIADLYVCMNEPEKALELLKKNNPDGLNDTTIGYTLATVLKKPDEALPYLSDALIDSVNNLFRITTAYANAFSDKGDYASALDALTYMRGILAGLTNPGATTYNDKELALLLAGCAAIALQKGDEAAARMHFAEALEYAERFDAAPNCHYTGMRFFYGNPNLTAFDDMGESTMDGIRRCIRDNADVAEELSCIWDELRPEHK